ncbi:hypothetical protein BC939DRAFT_412617 [Gamsiella multidivaricata]|uniref:uncharacterized protein n=1 Tax=Gamsiella multidivaricata TaxID=101098 RepID=UPI00222127ED|nr:uncharacterized protein BC939DRAFT_412617 [Gamsiella multidivaricata]KAG0368065.1 hypothetical protein BGZ54_002740 [Gamsiella multidivaricata]KAI7821025.1 hypothetical protein BC939DRAFT_412617 [Gamsiella multidivaricata]
MSNQVAAAETSHRNVPIADSGAKIPQHIKQVDRNQKFKLFECLQALVKGRLPTNEQIDHFLAMAQNSPTLDARAHMLSADGRALYKDFQELMRITRGVVYEKNEQELFQNFIYHCTQASDSVSSNVDAPRLDVGVSANTAKKEGKQTLDDMVAVAKLVTTNSEFRSILNELFQLAREVFSDSANKVAQNAQTAGDKMASASANFSQSAAQASQTGGARLQEGIYRATDRIQNVADDAQTDPMVTARGARDDLIGQKNQGMEAARNQVQDVRQQMAQQTGAFKQQAQAQAQQSKEDAINYANTKMPAEKRSELIERLKVILGQVQADPQYQKAIDSVMDLFGTWRQRAKNPAGNIAGEASKVTNDSNVEAAIIEFKVILQRWAQGYTLDPMIELVQSMWHRTMVDPDLSQFVDQLSIFMSKAVREPNYVTSDAINSDASTLIDHGQTLLKVKYRADTEALLNEGQIFIEKLNNDPKSREVSAQFQKFASDLFYDKHGNMQFKPHLFDDFRYVLMPSMLESFRFIPVPRVEYSDLKVDLMFDNMIVTSTDLLPRLFEMHINNTIRMAPRGNANRSHDTNKHEFDVLLEGIEANIRDVDYYVKTKEGFRFQDRGIADVLINKKGMDIRIKGRKTTDDKNNNTTEVPSLITLESVNVKIHALSIKMRKSNHPIMYAFAQPFIKTVVKNAIAHALETQIKEAMVSGDRAAATSLRDSRIRTGKNTFGALFDSASSFVSNKVSPDEKTKAKNERRKNTGQYNRTSRVIFDEDGLCVLDPVKHMELKVGQPLKEDPNSMPVAAPWASSAFNMDEDDMRLREHDQHLPGMRRTQGTLAM